MMKLSLFSLCLIVVACGKKHETQLYRVLTESTQSMQVMNTHIQDALKDKAYELRFEVEYNSKIEDRKASYSKLKYIYDRYLKIDSMCNAEINRLDALKEQLMEHCGINRSVIDKTDVPYSVDLSKLSEKELHYPTDDFFQKQENGQRISQTLFSDLKQFRNELTGFVGTYERSGFSFSFNPPHLNAFNTKKELYKSVEKMVAEQPINSKEDRWILIDLYAQLSYSESINGESWENHHFKNSSFLSAFSTLVRIQNDVLKAKQLAVFHILAFGCMADYPFTHILPLATGPVTAYAGDTIELKVLMVAFDTYNQPIVKVDNGVGVVSYPNDGTGRVKLNLPKGVHTIRGTVGIKNKSGIMKTEDWEYRVNVLEKS